MRVASMGLPFLCMPERDDLMEYRLFVYGSLRRGEFNHGLLGASKCEALLATLPGSLYDTGRGYPAMAEGEGGAAAQAGIVCGEIYRIDEETLARVDDLEDYYGPGDPRNLYERVKRTARTDRGEADVLVYVSDRLRAGPEIAFGEWKLYRMMKKPALLYFDYGGCMDDERTHMAGKAQWLGEVVGKGTVYGCQVRFIRHASDEIRADMVETGGATEGTLYRVPVEALEEVLYRREEARMDIYRPAVVPVTLGSGEIVDALAFVAAGKQPETANRK